MQIKVNTSENDCWNTDEIVCPYCGAVHGDSWEFGKGEDIGEMNCDHCGREFIATRNIKTTYSSRPAGTKPYVDWEEGDIFDDGITEDEAEKWANQNGEKPCEVVEQVHSWSEDYDGNVHILGREQKIKPIKKPCPYCDETPEPMIKKYEAERGGIMPCGMEIPGGFIYSKEYVAWLEAKANISDEAIEAFQKIIRNQCDEISALKENAESYGRIMSGGRKTLKEWANIFGMPVAVDQNGEASCFVHVPVMYLDEGEGIWTNNPDHYGEETYLLPTHLIDFNGDWTTSLTLPDGWEEK